MAVVFQPLSGFTCPVSERVGSWQARHICPAELSCTRNCCTCLSIDCTCGLWQVVHSMFPLISLIVLGAFVVPGDFSVFTRSGASCSGRSRLNGCERCSAFAVFSWNW